MLQRGWSESPPESPPTVGGAITVRAGEASAAHLMEKDVSVGRMFGVARYPQTQGEKLRIFISRSR
jgi:hypothetical protein